MSSPKFYSPTHSQTEMLGLNQNLGGNEGEGGAGPNESVCRRREWEVLEPLLLLVQVTQANGLPLPVNSFTTNMMVSLVQKQTGHHLVEVEVVTDRDAIIELEPDVQVGEVAQLLHGTQEWDGHLAEVDCLMSTQRSVVNVVQDRENGQARLLQLEEEQKKVREEQRQHQEQLAKFLTQFQEEVWKVESLQQQRVQSNATALQGVTGGLEEPRSLKPPILPPFSGADPVPKDEASCEQWVWQAKEALKSCTMGAVRIAIIQSIRGEVREFAASVGFKESMETLLDKVEDWFREKWTVDGLQQDFYKIAQDKNEKVRQFAGRLEAQFKKLKEKVPGHYDHSMLEECLFHGMNQQIRDSIRFCYKWEETTYKELFWEAVEAEKEKNMGMKITSLKVKSAVVEEEQTGIQELLKKIDALTTVVKSSTMNGARPKQNHGGTTPQKTKDGRRNEGNGYKRRGPATTSAGPFKPGQKPFQCYHCGGWGHSYKHCPSQGGIDWRTLNGAGVPPSPDKGPNPMKNQ